MFFGIIRVYTVVFSDPVTKNFVLDNCLTYGLFNDSYVYHSMTVSSAAELEKLIADGNVLLIIEEQAEQE